MKAALLALLLASPAAAGPIGAGDVHAATPTGFPAAYLGSIALAGAADPLYGSRFLDALQMHVQSIASLTAPVAVATYLEQSATAGQGAATLKAALGAAPLDPPKAAALLVANALARPRQFREVLDRLETYRPGMGRHAAAILRDAKGEGDKRVIAVLRAAGERTPKGRMLTYGPDGRFAALFDGAAAATAEPFENEAVAVDGFTGSGPDGRPRRTGLLPAKQ